MRYTIESAESEKLLRKTQSYDQGFDPFPFSLLFFILGGIMQSLFVPTMLTASNRAAQRDRIKDEGDHRAMSHMYEVNEKQLRLLRLLVDHFSLDRSRAAE